MSQWWLSFATEDECLDVAIVEADSAAGAMTVSHALGINLGGEVLLIVVPDDVRYPVDKMDRLYSKDEAAVLMDAERVPSWF